MRLTDGDYYRQAKRVSRMLLTDGIFLILMGVALGWPVVWVWLI